jgi:hypothetical protein
MTSANVTEYTIYDKETGEEVGTHSQHWYCKTKWENLLKFQPLENYEILTWWYDEEEEYNEGETVNLKDFVEKRIKI